MTVPKSEEDLMLMLRERAAAAPADPGRAQRAAVLGRRMRRRRHAAQAAVTAGALATAVLAVFALPGGDQDGPDPAQSALVSVRLPSEVPLPAKAGHFFKNETLPLIASRQYTRTGEHVRFQFTPLSTETIYNVRCAVPGSWLMVKTSTPSKARSLGRCGPYDSLAQYDAQSAGTSWTGHTQTLELWVLPPTETNPLADMDNLDKVMPRFEVRPGAWAVGIYDRRRA